MADQTERRQSPRSDSDIKSRLHNWARWIWVQELPTNGYPRAVPYARLIKFSPPTDDGSESAYEPPYCLDDAKKVDAAIHTLSARQRAVVRAHYVDQGASVAKAYRLQIALRRYFERLAESHELLSQALDKPH